MPQTSWQDYLWDSLVRRWCIYGRMGLSRARCPGGHGVLRWVGVVVFIPKVMRRGACRHVNIRSRTHLVFLPRPRPKYNFSVVTLRLGRRVTLDRFCGGGVFSLSQHKSPHIPTVSILTRGPERMPPLLPRLRAPCHGPSSRLSRKTRSRATSSCSTASATNWPHATVRDLNSLAATLLVSLTTNSSSTQGPVAYSACRFD